MEKLRILCLHGYHGSAGTLRGQMRSWADGLDPWATFVLVDAPSLASGDHGWWHAVTGKSANGGAGTEYRGWARTRDWIASLCAQAPFDGVFGFSQGAALAALLVGMCALGCERPPAPAALDFAIMVGGFMSRDRQHAPLYEALEASGPPSLHVIGRADIIVPSEASRALASRFPAPLIVEHDGAHVIAATPAIRRATLAFLGQMVRRKVARRTAAPVAAAPVAGAPPTMPALRSLDAPLWPGRARPSMRITFPAGPPTGQRPAMLVFRGGGYTRSDGSGAGSAAWAARHGMVGIEVDYATRSTGESYPRNYADAARAVRLARARAAEWGIDPARVGVMGYSAGGHLASLLSTQPALWIDPDDDLAPRISARPDLVVLAYPLISFVDGYAPGAFVGSVESFFGRAGVDEALRRQFSTELHVDPGHPPVFVWTTEDDALVPYTHAQAFADACRRAHVPVEYTLYPHGPHGLGLALAEKSSVRDWTTKLLTWLAQQWGAP